MRAKHFLSAAVLIFLFLFPLHSREYPLGIYITGLYNFDYVGQSFSTDFWLWSVYAGDETQFDGCIDPVNDLSFLRDIYSSEQIQDGRFWMQQKIQAVYQHKWEMRNFPFDTAELALELEDFRDADEITFRADRKNSGISNRIPIDGWEIVSFGLEDKTITYDTNFGNELVEHGGEYSRVCAKVKMRRSNPWITFFKLTSGVYISILISFLPFFMKPNTDSRLSLPSAGLFAVVSNKYVVESSVPSSTSLTLLDSIHSLAMICILLIFFILIQTDGMRASSEKRLLAKSFRIDRLSALIIALVFIVLNAVMLLR